VVSEHARHRLVRRQKRVRRLRQNVRARRRAKECGARWAKIDPRTNSIAMISSDQAAEFHLLLQRAERSNCTGVANSQEYLNVRGTFRPSSRRAANSDRFRLAHSIACLDSLHARRAVGCLVVRQRPARRRKKGAGLDSKTIRIPGRKCVALEYSLSHRS
jgi:hypothetical protein